jgi:WD40 repeat protein/serine/threonine protein kinase
MIDSPTPPSSSADRPDAIQLVARLRADQRRRWHQGDRVLAEAYRDQEPALRADEDMFLDVVYSEVLLREELGEAPCLQEYARRFPEHREALRLQFELHVLGVTLAWTAGIAPGGATATGATLLHVPGYELLGELGRGGMGVIYRARDRAFNRTVAVKLLQDRFPTDSDTALRFLDEARITGQLLHPAIPPVHQMGTLPNGRPFLVMKLVKGRTLAELLAEAPQDRTRFLNIFVQVCQGVAYAHSKDVIHRDLKPANIMVGSFGEVQVIDWGLAKVLTELVPATEQSPTELEVPLTVVQTGRDSSSLTEAGSTLGTPEYMPPEQAKGNIAATDRRADVFALGGMLCKLLTGQPPYVAPTVAEVQALALTAQLGPAFARLDTCGADPYLVELVKKCLAADPAARPADAGAVARDVAAHLAAAAERARQAELERVRSEEQRKRRRVQLTLVLSVLGLLVATGFGVVLAFFWQDAEQARREALEAKGKAVTARDAEIQARDKAEEAKREAITAREKLARVEYGRTMQVAYEHWHDGNASATLELLQKTRQNLRGWEWDYVHQLCHTERFTLRGHTDFVASASFSPDGSRIVTGSWDRTARVWDARSGRPLLILAGKMGHRDGVVSASFSPDGKRIVTTSEDQTAKVWQLTTEADGSVRARDPLTFNGLNEHPGTVESASFSKDGKWVVTANGDHTVAVWDVEKGNELLTLPGHTARVTSVCFSLVDLRIVTTSEDQTAKVWQLTTEADGSVRARDPLTLVGHRKYVVSASFSPDGSRIVTGSWDRTARVWDARSGRPLLTLEGHTDRVESATFSADDPLHPGIRIITFSADNTVRVWDGETGKQLRTIRGLTDFRASLPSSPDGSQIITACEDQMAKVWDARTGPDALTLSADRDHVYTVSFSPDGKWIVTASDDQTAKVWDARTGALVLTLQGHRERVWAASFSPDGLRIITSSRDGTARVWDVATGEELFQLSEHTHGVMAASFSPDGSRIVTGSWDHTARVWDARTGERLHTLEGHTRKVNTASFSPDGKWIVTGSDDRTAKVWDARTGAELLTFNGHTGTVESASFSKDGKWVVTASGDYAAKVWDARSGAELLTLKGHTGGVWTASFSPDGSRIVTGGKDRTVRVWDARTGVEVLALKGHTGYVCSASFSPDGWRIATGSFDGTAKVWGCRPIDRESPREAKQP